LEYILTYQNQILIHTAKIALSSGVGREQIKGIIIRGQQFVHKYLLVIGEKEEYE
jgi:hypothetical protein